MSEKENHFTVFIRLPFKRGDFVDPPPVAWSASKERELWDVISRQSKGNEIDWGELAVQFKVTQQFLLQQAAWLYERQLSQVRAQMRRMGSRQSATASPAPNSTAGSMVGTQPSKRLAMLASRGPSRLSTQIPPAAVQGQNSAPNTPARSRASLILKPNTTGGAAGSARGQPATSRPLSRKSSKDTEPGSRIHSRRGSVQNTLSRSPGELRPAELSSTSEDENVAKPNHRRPSQVSVQRRTSLSRKTQYAKTSSLSVHQLQEEREEDEDEEDDPAFLPFAASSSRDDHIASNSNDPSATLRGGLISAPAPTAPAPASSSSISGRPHLQRNRTSERIQPTTTTMATTMTTATTKTPATATGITAPLKQSESTPQPQHHTQPTSSDSSLSSNNTPALPKSAQTANVTITTATTTNAAVTATGTSPHQTATSPHPAQQHTSSHRAALQTAGNLPVPLSPRQQAALANAAGLSPRRRASANPSGTTPSTSTTTTTAAAAAAHHHHHHRHNSHTGYTGSESSPSMGSSFSDLDDASVTQSALEEALMSNMNALGSTTTIAGIGALGSRVSGISQALRSRYFDARSGSGNGSGNAANQPADANNTNHNTGG